MTSNPRSRDSAGSAVQRLFAPFGNQLKRRLDTVSVVEVHQLVAEVEAGLAFDVVRQHRAAGAPSGQNQMNGMPSAAAP